MGKVAMAKAMEKFSLGFRSSFTWSRRDWGLPLPNVKLLASRHYQPHYRDRYDHRDPHDNHFVKVEKNQIKPESPSCDALHKSVNYPHQFGRGMTSQISLSKFGEMALLVMTSVRPLHPSSTSCCLIYPKSEIRLQSRLPPYHQYRHCRLPHQYHHRIRGLKGCIRQCPSPYQYIERVDSAKNQLHQTNQSQHYQTNLHCTLKPCVRYLWSSSLLLSPASFPSSTHKIRMPPRTVVSHLNEPHRKDRQMGDKKKKDSESRIGDEKKKLFALNLKKEISAVQNSGYSEKKNFGIVLFNCRNDKWISHKMSETSSPSPNSSSPSPSVSSSSSAKLSGSRKTFFSSLKNPFLSLGLTLGALTSSCIVLDLTAHMTIPIFLLWMVMSTVSIISVVRYMSHYAGRIVFFPSSNRLSLRGHQTNGLLSEEPTVTHVSSIKDVRMTKNFIRFSVVRTPTTSVLNEPRSIFQKFLDLLCGKGDNLANSNAAARLLALIGIGSGGGHTVWRVPRYMLTSGVFEADASKAFSGPLGESNYKFHPADAHYDLAGTLNIFAFQRKEDVRDWGIWGDDITARAARYYGDDDHASDERMGSKKTQSTAAPLSHSSIAPPSSSSSATSSSSSPSMPLSDLDFPIRLNHAGAFLNLQEEMKFYSFLSEAVKSTEARKQKNREADVHFFGE